VTKIDPNWAGRFRALAASILVALFASGCDAGHSVAPPAPTMPQANTVDARILTLDGQPIDPFATAADKPTVIFFLGTDCPIANRYAPEIRRFIREFASQFQFWLVYPGRDLTPEAIRQHLKEFELDSVALRDPNHVLVRLASARVTPEAAVFDAQRRLLYHGRIDDRFVAFGEARPAPTTRELHDVLSALAAGHQPLTQSAPAVGCAIPPNP
jgi:hypothetical protein